MKRNCKLCGQERILCNSHIMPKSIIKRMRRGSPQIVEISYSDEVTAIKSNGDPKEYLLCEECELLLKVEYEDYGTVYLSKAKDFITNKHQIIAPHFNYKKYYLFIISILWRASISTLQIYKSARKASEISPFIRHCLLNKTLITTFDGHRIDELLKISIERIVDTQHQLQQSLIDRAIILPNIYNEENRTSYFMMFDGYFISIFFFTPDDTTKDPWIKRGRLINRGHLKIPKVCFRSIAPVTSAFNAIPAAKDPFNRPK